jgi:predicted membrane-bound spermidine synthase
MRIDPLIGSLILFSIPSALLAMVGPCAVRVLTRKASDAGKMSGWVFALGSLGSIAGVLVTSFWLIAVLGTGANLRLTGLITFALGLVAAGSVSRTKRAGYPSA